MGNTHWDFTQALSPSSSSSLFSHMQNRDTNQDAFAQLLELCLIVFCRTAELSLFKTGYTGNVQLCSLSCRLTKKLAQNVPPMFPCGSVPLVRALQTLRGTISAHIESSYLYISALNLITRIMVFSRDLATPFLSLGWALIKFVCIFSICK